MRRIEPYVARTAGLAETASVVEMIEGALVPGKVGITLRNQWVRFGDLYKMTQKTGVEYALTRETVDGRKVFRLYSGGRNGVTTPRGPNVRVIRHTHPTGLRYPSPRDLDVINDQFVQALEKNPFASVPHERVIHGSGNTESTIYRPNVLR